MALLDIKKAGAPILKEECGEVEKVDESIIQLLDDMAETMYEAKGVGLAAPQVGLSIRVIVIDIGKGLHEMINPVILKREGKTIDTEGCLSVPEIVGEVERSEKVRVEFTNRRGKRQKLRADGLLARCIQHEIDHLNGRLFIDIAKSLKKEAKKK